MQHHSTLSPAQAFFRNKWVRLALVFDVILIIILVVVLIWQATKVSTISFDITPIDATISINGNSDYHNGQYPLTPGTYQVTISHAGLAPKTFTVDIVPDHVMSLTTFLTDETQTFEFYQQRANFTSYQKLAEIASMANNITTDHDTSAETFLTRFQSSYDAFTHKLPLEYREDEGYGQDRSILKNITFKAKYDCQLTLCIHALVVGTDDKAFINSILQQNGFNTEDFEIEYKFY